MTLPDVILHAAIAEPKHGILVLAAVLLTIALAVLFTVTGSLFALGVVFGGTDYTFWILIFAMFGLGVLGTYGLIKLFKKIKKLKRKNRTETPQKENTP